MNRRQFIASLPALAAVGEEKKQEKTITIDGFECSSEYSHWSGILVVAPKWNSWRDTDKACLKIWGKESIGRPMTVTVHPVGYDVRFV